MRIMISGNFNPFHYGHLAYLKQAVSLGDQIVCIVSSDKQVLMKKGKVNEPQDERVDVLRVVLRGLGVESPYVFVNVWDTEDTTVAKALSVIQPDVFLRGSDKTPEDFPLFEKEICSQYNINVIYAHSSKITHGSGMTVDLNDY